MTLQPHPVDKCIITYRKHKTARAFAFDGEVVFAPRLIMRGGNVAALIKCEFFQIRYGESRLEFQSAEDILTTHRSTVMNWSKYLNFCAGLCTSGGEIEIAPKSAAVTIRLPLERIHFDGVDFQFYGYYAKVTDFLREILQTQSATRTLQLYPFVHSLEMQI